MTDASNVVEHHKNAAIVLAGVRGFHSTCVLKGL